MVGMPYDLEKGPYFSVVEDFLRDRERMITTLQRLRDGTEIVHLGLLESPSLDGDGRTPLDRARHLNEDWFGMSWDGAHQRWYSQPPPSCPPPPPPPTTGFWENWYGDAEAIFRQTMIRAIEVALGVDHGAPVAPHQATPRHWVIELFLEVPGTMVRGMGDVATTRRRANGGSGHCRHRHARQRKPDLADAATSWGSGGVPGEPATCGRRSRDVGRHPRARRPGGRCRACPDGADAARERTGTAVRLRGRLLWVWRHHRRLPGRAGRWRPERREAVPGPDRRVGPADPRGGSMNAEERDPLATVRIVQTDIESVLVDAFPPLDGGGFRLSGAADAVEALLTNDRYTAVPWEYTGVHRKPFAGIEPTGVTVTFRAVTIVDHSGNEPTFSRYIDWMSVMMQLGVPSYGRPVVDSSVAPPRMTRHPS